MRENPIKGLNIDDQFFAGFRFNDPFDQFIESGIFDAHIIPGSRSLGGFASPHITLLVTGRAALGVTRNDHTEFEISQTFFIFRNLHDPDIQMNADLF